MQRIPGTLVLAAAGGAGRAILVAARMPAQFDRIASGFVIGSVITKTTLRATIATA